MSYSLGDFSEQLADLVQTRQQHVVRVEGRAQYPSSGIFWSREGLIVTANYALTYEESVMVGLPGGEHVSARLIGRDPGTDVALLEIDPHALGVRATPPGWVATKGIRLGHMLVTIARPGRTPRCASGVVSTLSGQWRTPEGGTLERYIQTDCLTRPGFSGSLVIDVQGRTIGMLTAGLLNQDYIIVPTVTLGHAVVRILRAARGSAPAIDIPEG